MSGSLKYFRYQSDNGQTYGIKADESNGEAIGNADLTAADVGVTGLPRNIRERFAVYRSADGKYTRKIPVCQRARPNSDLPASISIDPGDAAGNVTVFLAYTRGERETVITPVDSGLDDGDAT